MPLVCPNCQNVVEVDGASAPSEAILCGVCGSSIKADADLTISAAVAISRRKIGRFELGERVGSGAFGAVFRARDLMLGRAVAIKIPHLGDLSQPQDVERFLREARSVAQLHHAGIVPVHEVGYAEGVPYLVSEFVEGVTLADRLTAGRLPARDAAELIAAVADALAYAHTQGVIHRDVKPSNIMFMQDGRPRLMDFGLAKRDAGEATMTTEGEILGTPAYMSPEQARGEAHLVDGRSDVYSVGVVLYQVLCGELPFRGNSRMVLHQVINDEPRPPRLLDDRIPRDLETICLKSISKEPSHRYATAGELAEDLRRFLDGLPVCARPVGMLSRGWLWCHRADRIREAGALAIFIGVVLIAWALYGMTYHTLVGSVSRPAEAIWQRLVLILAFFAPIIWVGVRTLGGSLAALWIGTLLSLGGILFVTAFAFQEHLGLSLQFGGSYTVPASRVPIVSLFSILCGIMAGAYLIALAAYRANHNVMRWQRTGDLMGSSTRS